MVEQCAAGRRTIHCRWARAAAGLGWLAAWLLWVTPLAAGEKLHEATTAKPFELVVADAEFAIAEHNFRITSRNDLGSGIGGRAAIPFPQSVILQFCSLDYAQRLLELDPKYIRAMPCRVFVYERDGQVVVESPLLAEDDTRGGRIAAEVNGILRAIVAYAAE